MIFRKQETTNHSAGMLKKFSIIGVIAAAAIVLATVSAAPAEAGGRKAHYKVLYNFCSQPNCEDGDNPLARLSRDELGNLYGTTTFGGPTDRGVVFRLNRSGEYKVLHSFAGQEDGVNPQAGVILDQAGNLYGTSYGGAAGAGVVFRLDFSGNFTVLHSFTGGADGGNPLGDLILDEAGNLYGTAGTGGNFGVCRFGCGVLFKLDPSGRETVLYNFTGGADGASPRGSLVRDEAGNLYGTSTSYSVPGAGVVFKLDRSENLRVLYTFTGGADGGDLTEGLIRDRRGNLYGTATLGGNLSSPTCAALAGCGVVFKISPRGEKTTLYTFMGGADGAQPGAGLTLGGDGRQDSNGDLYGTTFFGGNVSNPPCTGFAFGCGVVFKVDRWGRETVLHSLAGPEGSFPSNSVLLKHHDALYGTTPDGGSGYRTGGGGVIFKLSLDEDCDHGCDDERGH